MTTAAILQPGYLPWLGFFEQMHYADVFVYLDDVQYTKNDWRNRNRVKTANGPAWLTVPILTRGRHGLSLVDTQVADRDWARRHLRTVEIAYAKAPFKHLASGLYDIWTAPPKGLLELDLLVAEWCRETLTVRTPTVLASSLRVTAENATSRLVKLCQAVDADRFYEGAAGRAYMDLSLFEAAGVELLFQDYRHPVYPQQHQSLGFISHLSVLDLILNTGPDALSILSGQIACDGASDVVVHHADEFREGNPA